MVRTSEWNCSHFNMAKGRGWQKKGLLNLALLGWEKCVWNRKGNLCRPSQDIVGTAGQYNRWWVLWNSLQSAGWRFRTDLHNSVSEWAIVNAIACWFPTLWPLTKDGFGFKSASLFAIEWLGTKMCHTCFSNCGKVKLLHAVNIKCLKQNKTPKLYRHLQQNDYLILYWFRSRLLTKLQHLLISQCL